jgi:hypothetical protein
VTYVDGARGLSMAHEALALDIGGRKRRWIWSFVDRS